MKHNDKTNLENRCRELEEQIEQLKQELKTKTSAVMAPQMREFFDRSRDGIVVIDMNRRIIDANQAFCDMLGYTIAELKQIGETSVLTVEKWRKWEIEEIGANRLAKVGYSDLYEKEYIHKKGYLVPVEMQSYVGYDIKGNPDFLWAIVRDITERKHSEFALKEREETLRSYFDNAPHGVLIVDEQGNLVKVNTAACMMTGYQEDELIGVSLRLFVHKGADKNPFDHFKHVVKEGYAVEEMQYKRKDGEIRWWRIATVRLNENRFMGFTTDTTDRHKAEEKYTTLFNQMLNGFILQEIIIDESGKPVDYRFLAANPAFEKITGIMVNDIIGKNVTDIFPTIDPKFIEKYAEIAITGISRQFIEYHHEKDKYFQISVFRPAPGQFASIIEDITEKEKNAETIARLNERFELAATAANIGVWDLDVKQNNLVWDKRMYELYDMPPDQFESTFEAWHRHVHPGDIEAVMARIEEAKLKEMPLDIEFRIITSIGAIRYLKGIGIALRGKDGEAYRMTGINYDITERKEMEQALRRREEYLNSIIHTTVDGFLISDLQGRLIEVNDAYCEMTGYRREEILTMRLEDIEVGDDYDMIMERARRIIRNGSEIFESIHKRKDGSIVPVELSISFMNEQGGQFITFCRDLSERKKAERAVRQSEVLAQTVIEHSPIGISVRSTTGQLIFYNQAWLDIWEMTPERLQEDLKPRDHLMFGDRDEYLSEHQQNVRRVYSEGGTYYVPEIQTTGKRSLSGKKRFLSQHFSGIKNDRGEVERVVILTTDITEGKLAEEELRKSEERFRSFVENANDIVYALDENGIFTYISPNWKQFIGEPAEEAIGKPFVPYVHPDDVPICLDLLKKAVMTDDQMESVEYRVLHKDGTYRWNVSTAARIRDKNGKPISYVGIARDVTEAKKAEAERERLIAAIEQAGETVVITDQYGIIGYVNPAFEEVTGYSREEAIGKNPNVLKSGEHDKEFYDNLWHTIASGAIWKGRFINKKKDGSLYTEEATISPVRDKTGKITNFVAVKRDITRELELERQFMQSQKMESVGRLAGGIAHDFNNMLLVILGHSELILDETKENRELADSVREIQHAAQHSADLTRQLLAFARKQTASPKILDINHTVDGMLKMLRRMIGESIDLLWLPGTDVSTIRIDPAQLAQILANLAVNARDAIDDIGSITIETANIELDEVYCERATGCKPGQYVMLTITDSGHGMDETTVQQIFEPFFTTKDVGEGTGLGLATVYGIVMQNHGHIAVYSEIGHGTSFHIYFPAQIEKLSEDQIGIGRDLPAGKSERILMVDDEPAILRMGRIMLERLGYNVITAQDPKEAIQIADRYHYEIDLLVTDVIMPEMNGNDLAKHLAARNHNMKYLFMSGYTANVINKQGILEDNINFLQKPFSLHALATRVKETLEQKPKT